MQLDFVPLTTFSASIQLDRHVRSEFSGSSAVVMTDAGGHVEGMTGEILFPVGTATSLIVPWSLESGSDTFSAAENCILTIQFEGGAIAAALRYVELF